MELPKHLRQDKLDSILGRLVAEKDEESSRIWDNPDAEGLPGGREGFCSDVARTGALSWVLELKNQKLDGV